MSGAYEQGATYIERSLAEYRRLEDEWGIAHMLFRLAVDAFRVGDAERATALADESLAIHSNKKSECQVLTLLADIAFGKGDHDRAFELLERAAELAEETGFVWWNVRATAADYALRADRLEDAQTWAREGLTTAFEIGDRMRTVYCLAVLAWHASATGRPEASGLLWGAIEAEEARGAIGQWDAERDEYAGHLLSDDEAFVQMREAGRELTLDEAVAYALEGPDA